MSNCIRRKSKIEMEKERIAKERVELIEKELLLKSQDTKNLVLKFETQSYCTNSNETPSRKFSISSRNTKTPSRADLSRISPAQADCMLQLATPVPLVNTNQEMFE